MRKCTSMKQIAHTHFIFKMRRFVYLIGINYREFDNINISRALNINWIGEIWIKKGAMVNVVRELWTIKNCLFGCGFYHTKFRSWCTFVFGMIKSSQDDPDTIYIKLEMIDRRCIKHWFIDHTNERTFAHKILQSDSIWLVLPF